MELAKPNFREGLCVSFRALAVDVTEVGSSADSHQAKSM